MQVLLEYGLFLAKTITWVIALLLLVGGVLSLLGKGKTAPKSKLKLEKLNDQFDAYKQQLQENILEKSALKKLHKQEKKADKTASSNKNDSPKAKLFVLKFNGDIKASAVQTLREEITAILTVAAPGDEVVLRLESGGGVVHGYGLAASQLMRLKAANLKLTICIDKIAASGGYMMACVADHIVSAPFAIIGSIGVIAQIPNVHRLLKKNHIDFEQVTAGEYKRTLTVFGENHEKDRQKMQQELEETHELFKQFIRQNRPLVDLTRVATGEHWFGTQALSLQLVDELGTSDDHLLKQHPVKNIYKISYQQKKSVAEKLAKAVQSSVESFSLWVAQKAREQRYL